MSQKNENLKETFKQAAADYVANFVELENLVVTSTKKPIYVSEKVAETLKHKPCYLKKVVRFGRKHMRSEDAGIAFYFDNVSGQGFIKTVAMATDLSKKAEQERSAEDRIHEMKTFDHEVGHLLAGVSYSRSEFFPDAFTALMHIKRFGKDTDYLQKRPLVRAGATIISGRTSHYTSSVWFAAEKLSKEVDIQSLSNRDILTYAGVLTSMYQLEEKQLKEIKKAYALPSIVFKALQTTPLKLIAKAMLKNKNNEEVYRAGRLVIAYLEPHPSLKGNLRNKNSFWKKAFAEMEAHEKATGFVLNPVEAYDKKHSTDSVKLMIEKKSRQRNRVSSLKTSFC